MCESRCGLVAERSKSHANEKNQQRFTRPLIILAADVALITLIAMLFATVLNGDVPW